MHRYLPFLFAVIAALLAGCGGGGPSGTQPPSITSVAVTPTTVNVALGLTQQFSAKAAYSDGTTADVTSSATWSSTATGIATVNTAGLATTKSQGTTTITAQLRSISGSASLVVGPAVPSSVAVTPATANVALGLTQQFSAKVTYSDGTTGDATSSATWSSSTTVVATITSGFAMTESQGNTTITAQVGSVSGSASLVVGPAALTSIALRGPATIQLGGTAQFKAMGNYTDGTQQDLSSTVIWSLATAFRAQISVAGLLTPNSTGWENVTATLGSMSSTATIVITTVPRYVLASSFTTEDGISVFAVNPTNFALRSRGYLPAGSGVSPSSTALHPSQPWLYVANAGANTVSGYVVGTDGSLTSIPGSPTPTGINPGYVTVDPAGKFLFVSNRNSDTVSIFLINNTDGSLSPASTPSVATGSEPNGIAVDPSDRFVYVVDRLSNDVLTYTLDPSLGTLTLTGNAVPTVANPIAVVADPTGKFLYVGGTLVDAYTIAPSSGMLTLVAGSPFGSNGEDAFSLAVDPFGKFLYYGDIVAGTVHSTTINPTSGALSETSGSPISAGNNPLSMQVDPSGGFLYVLSAGDASVWGYSIDSTTGALTFSSRASSLAAGTSLAVLGGAAPVQYVPTYAYVANSGSSAVTGYSINGASGSLTALSTSPFAFTSAPQGIGTDLLGRWVFTADFMASKVSQGVITSGGSLQSIQDFSMTAGSITSPESVAVDMSGRFLFVPANSGALMDYVIDPANDTLSPNPLLDHVTAGTNPVAVAVDPAGKFVYSAAFGSDAIYGFNIDTHTGVLNATFLSPYLTGVKPTAIAVDPSGQFLYVANFGSNDISAYQISLTNGNLVAVGSGTIAAGVQPDALVVSQNGKYLYVANLGDSTVLSYSIDQQTGALTPILSAVSVDSPSAMAQDATGQYLYITSQNTNTVTAFSIDQSTGALSVVGSPVPTGTQPRGVITTGAAN